MNTAPQMLGEIERAIQCGDPAALAQVAALIEHPEVTIQWAVSTARGAVTAEAITAGREADPALPAEQRLMNRLTRFLTTKVDRAQFADLAREFAGADAVEGNQIYRDPSGGTEAFSQWLLHDIVLPAAPGRVIEWFAKEQTDNLLADERPLLEAYLHDRPSIYQVVTVSRNRQTHRPKETYQVQDLLSRDEVLRITDRTTSCRPRQPSVFMGRVIPVDGHDGHFHLLGTITELPAMFCARLSPVVDKWQAEFRRNHPNATRVAFYRAHHARLVRTIAEL